ncbi:hypothetical protein IMCC9480_3869 [Oxalobacteraceae bacterium IMCC9480]|nr:hypothetical protein IMCC9480_3869 [Oxalobacteraceae bacterium IMCC9480]
MPRHGLAGFGGVTPGAAAGVAGRAWLAACEDWLGACRLTPCD